MGLIRKHYGHGVYRKFDGKPYEIYGKEKPTEHGIGFTLHDYSTKSQADGAADRLRSMGYLVRVVESPFAGTKKYILYKRKRD